MVVGSNPQHKIKMARAVTLCLDVSERFLSLLEDNLFTQFLKSDIV